MRHARLRSAVPLFLGLLLLVGRLPAQEKPSPSRQHQNQERMACAVVGDATPAGLVVVLVSTPGEPLKLEAVEKRQCLEKEHRHHLRLHPVVLLHHNDLYFCED